MAKTKPTKITDFERLDDMLEVVHAQYDIEDSDDEDASAEDNDDITIDKID
jgi:hypothetical protein